MKIYCDTCLYLDIFEQRKDKFRDLADFALQIFRRVKEGEFILIISDWLMTELKRNANEESISDLLDPLKKAGRVIKFYKTKNDIKKAKIISPKHYDDAMHAVLAHKAKAVYLLTRNLKHYAGCDHLVEIKFPENI